MQSLIDWSFMSFPIKCISINPAFRFYCPERRRCIYMHPPLAELSLWLLHRKLWLEAKINSFKTRNIKKVFSAEINTFGHRWSQYKPPSQNQISTIIRSQFSTGGSKIEISSIALMMVIYKTVDGGIAPPSPFSALSQLLILRCSFRFGWFKPYYNYLLSLSLMPVFMVIIHLGLLCNIMKDTILPSTRSTINLYPPNFVNWKWKIGGGCQ